MINKNELTGLQLKGSLSAINRQFNQYIAQIPDDQMIYLSIEHKNSPELIDHVVAVDTKIEILKKWEQMTPYHNSLGQKLNKILSGDIELNEFHFVQFIIEDTNSRHIHRYKNSLGKKNTSEKTLQGRGLMKRPFAILTNILMEHFGGWTISNVAIHKATETFMARIGARLPSSEEEMAEWAQIAARYEDYAERHKHLIMFGTIPEHPANKCRI